MIKVVFCLRRLPHLSLEEFQRYWREKHAPVVREVAPALNIRRYVQSHFFADPRIMAGLDARGGTVGPYDGVAELWWNDVDDIIAASSTPEGRASGRRLLADEKNFIDLPNSRIFFAVEHEIVG